MDTPLVRPVLTYDDLRRLNRQGRRCEIFDGELFESPVPTLRHQRTAQRLARAFEEAVRDGRDGSRVLTEMDVVLAPGTVARPDLALVLADHLDILDEPGGVVRGAPDLILEILSPATVRLDRVIKMDAYARYSVPEHWLVDGNSKLIEIFRLDPHAQLYRLTETCNAGDWARTPLVPGLAVEVGRLFA